MIVRGDDGLLMSAISLASRSRSDWWSARAVVAAELFALADVHLSTTSASGLTLRPNPPSRAADGLDP
jgi:hypothetical protein